ncbi:hypothetical protein C345_01539 [Cryptococcus neoformans A2-102-5]|nr:hypothetical protein C346_01580 [Cryptococcus neoformans var. grubii D17-1]OXG97887.1 hypothetical protein C345_01539 [Cryptococcus neoformans var. grubii A2-102-5]
MPSSLVLFTTSQTPLAVRYPHPRKPILNVPPLLHRSLHNALDRDQPSAAFVGNAGGVEDVAQGTLYIPNLEELVKPSPLAVPNGHASPELVHDNIELTVKVHLIVSPTSTPTASARADWVNEALQVFRKAKRLPLPDNLLIGFNGIDYRGIKTATGAEGSVAPDTEVVPGELEQEVLKVWERVFAEQDKLVKEGGKLGSLYAPQGLLRKLTEREGGRRVKVNALDTPDCHHLPKDYTGYARKNGVELWAGGGGEGSDPLPSAHLQNVLQEFLPAIRKIVPEQQAKEFSKLDSLIPLRQDGLKFEDVETGVQVRWVLSYTVLSTTRNVVEDKGYIVAADLV